MLWRDLLQNTASPSNNTTTLSRRAQLPDFTNRRIPFPNFDFIKPEGRELEKRQNATVSSSSLIPSMAQYGPLFTRLIDQNLLASPMFAITLQRDSVDIGGNVGMLSVGELPQNISSSSLTWVPLREYPYGQGGLPAPPDAPNEVRLFVEPCDTPADPERRCTPWFGRSRLTTCTLTGQN